MKNTSDTSQHFFPFFRENFFRQTAQKPAYQTAEQKQPQILQICIGIKPQGHPDQISLCQLKFLFPVQKIPSCQQKRQKQ